MKEERNILGLDIGAHKVAAVVLGGKVVFSKYKVYPQEVKRDWQEWSLWFRQFVEIVLAECNVTIDAIGIGIAGVLKEGKVLKSPNFSILDGEDLKGLMVSVLKKEVRIDNDAKCFLRAESQRGGAAGFKNVVGIDSAERDPVS